MIHRPNAERLAALRQAVFNTGRSVPCLWAIELFTELDAVTRERDDFQRVIDSQAQSIVGLSRMAARFERERDDAREALENSKRGAMQPCGDLAGMNFITNRER